MLAAVSNTVLRALLGPTCASCDRPLDAPLDGALCEHCCRSAPAITPPICFQCGDHLPGAAMFEPADNFCGRCRSDPPAVAMARSGGVYDGSLRDMVHALKYQKRRMIAPWLAARMLREGIEVLDGADAVVPVPLHPWRQWQRGFNQADDLAIELDLPVWRILRKRRGGPPQASLSAAERQANARGAYAVTRRERLGRGRLAGAVVVLVDDVMTTGATLNACASVLLREGAASVRALTAARAVAARPLRPPPIPHPSSLRR
jgi:ComF family protein